MDYLTEIAMQEGISLWILIAILVWTIVWKLIGLWKSARNSHVIWFILIAFINTVGIIPILYIYVFSKINSNKQKNIKKNPTKKKKSSKKK